MAAREDLPQCPHPLSTCLTLEHFTQWFEHDTDMIHKSWPSQSPYLNPIDQLWDISRSTWHCLGKFNAICIEIFPGWQIGECWHYGFICIINIVCCKMHLDLYQNALPSQGAQHAALEAICLARWSSNPVCVCSWVSSDLSTAILFVSHLFPPIRVLFFKIYFGGI